MNRQEFLSNNARKKIIIAAVDKEAVENLTPALANEGYEAIGCYTVNEVLEHEHEHIDAFLINVDFDGNNGSQLVELVRQLKVGEKMPILVCAENQNSEGVIEALNAGADDYIFRPCAARDIVARIEASIAARH